MKIHQHKWYKREKKVYNGIMVGFVCECRAKQYVDLLPFKQTETITK